MFAPLAAAFSHVQDSAIIYSADGEIVVWNAGAESLFGYTFDEARRRDVSFLCAPEDSGSTLNLFSRALSAQSVEPRQVDRIRKDGSRVRVSVRVSPLENGKGEFFGVLFLARDVAPEVEREQRLTELMMRERDIAALVPDAIYVHRGGKILWANPAAIEMFGAQSQTDFIGRSAWDLIVADDLPRVMDRHADLGDSMASKPIFVRRQRIDGEEFPSEGRGAQIAWEDGPATLMVVRDLSEHERTVSALVESEERQRDFAEISPDAVIVHIDGEIVFANQAAAEMFAASRVEQLIGLQNSSLVTPDDWARVTASWEADPDSQSDFIQVRQIRLDGSTFEGQGRGKPIVWDGHDAFLVAIRDVTEQIERQAALREAEARQWDFAAISPDAMLVHVGGEIVFVNEAARQMFRAESEADLIGRSVLDTIHPDDRESLQANINAKLGSNSPDFFDVRRLRLDGTSFLGEGRFRTIDWKGANGVLVVIRDVTDRVAAQNALLDSESRLREITELSPDAIIVHIDGEIVFANPAAASIFGVPSCADLIGRSNGEFVHPEDWALIEKTWPDQFADNDARVIEVRQVRADGTPFLGEGRSKPVNWDGRAALLVVVRDITEHVEAEQTLLESEERHRQIVETIPDAVLIHVDEKIVFTNKTAVELLGAPDEAGLLGRSIEDLIPERMRARAVDRRKLAVDLGNIRSSGKARMRLDGSEFLADVSASRYFWNGKPAILTILRDVTERIEADNVREALEARNRKILELSPEAIFVHSAGLVRYANHAAVRMFGADAAGDLLGRMIMDLVHPDEHDGIIASREKMVGEKLIPHADVRRLRIDGSDFYTRSTGAIIDWEGEDGFIVIAHDITQERATQEQIRLRTEELERANAELERFAYVASHDLKEPLRMVSSFCGLLQERYADQLDAQAGEFIGFAVDGAKRMQGLIDDLMRLSKTGTSGLTSAPVDMNRIVEEVKLNLGAQIADAGAEIRSEPLPVVKGDRTLLMQLFQNLISNGIKFRSDVSPVIDVRTDMQDGVCAFAVSDNGLGMDPKHHERVFEVFKTLNPRGKFEGNGVGLSICKKVVERHGGRMWIESAPGQGTSFWFTLPVVSGSEN